MTLDAQLMLGMVVLRQKQYPEAERLILDATNEIARVQGPDSMATVRTGLPSATTSVSSDAHPSMV